MEQLKELSQNLKVFPVPARDELLIEFTNPIYAKEFTKAEILNNMSQIVKIIDVHFNRGKAMLVTTDLLHGSYFLRSGRISLAGICKRFISLPNKSIAAFFKWTLNLQNLLFI